MQEPDELFKNLGKMAGENFVKSHSGKLDDHQRQTAETYFMLLLLGVLLFVGADAIKVLLRTNFGRRSISRLRMVIFAFLFFKLSFFYVLFSTFTLSDNEMDFFINNGGQPGLIIAALFYTTLAVVVLINGFKERNASFKSDNPVYYGGDSVLLHFLIERGMKQRTVQMIVEPLLVFSVGILLTGINLFLGAPIILCGISLTLYQIYEKIMLIKNPVRNVLEQSGRPQNPNYSEVM